MNKFSSKHIIFFLILVILVLLGVILSNSLSKDSAEPIPEPIEEEIVEEEPTGYKNETFGFSLSPSAGYSIRRFSDSQFSVRNERTDEILVDAVVLSAAEGGVQTSLEEFVLDRARLICAEQLESPSECLLIEDRTSFTSNFGAEGQRFYIEGENEAGVAVRHGPVYVFQVGNESDQSALFLFSPFSREPSAGSGAAIEALAESLAVES